jgi:flagellar basal-body rod protein FlgC
MDFLKTISVAASGLKAQSGRMRVIAENIANADSTADKPGADPYRRKVPSFQRHFDRDLETNVVEMGRVAIDRTAFRTRFDPGHPAADEKGEVKLPNVNSLIETVDMREAQRSYEANLSVIEASKTLLTRTIEILRG